MAQLLPLESLFLLFYFIYIWAEGEQERTPVWVGHYFGLISLSLSSILIPKMARMTEVIKVRIPIFTIRPARTPVTLMLLLPSQDQAKEEQGSVVFDDIM